MNEWGVGPSDMHASKTSFYNAEEKEEEPETLIDENVVFKAAMSSDYSKI